MSTYLDQLIKTVEAEAAEEQVHLKEQERLHRFPSKRSKSGLNRALQRLEVLKSLRKYERPTPTALFSVNATAESIEPRSPRVGH